MRFNVKVWDEALKNGGQGNPNVSFADALAKAINGMSVGQEVTITPVEEKFSDE